MRIIQRWAVLLAGLLSFVYWTTIIALTVVIMYGQQAHLMYQNPEKLSQTAKYAVDVVGNMALGGCGVAFALTLLSCMYARTRTFDRTRIVDSLAIVGFLVIIVLLAQPLVNQFLQIYIYR